LATLVKLQFDKWFRREDAVEAARSPEEVSNGQVIYLPLDTIKPSPYQTRTEFDEMELKELAQSIQEFGIIQPIVVRQTPRGYELVAGERRVRASRLGGMTEIAALVVEMDNEKAAAVTLIENVQRSALNYLEEAEAYQLLIKEFGFKQEELARRVGKSQSTIANKLRLLKLPADVRSAIRVELVTERHARALLQLESLSEQKEILKTIVEQELTVKATEELIHKVRQQKTSQEGQKAILEDSSWVAARRYISSIKEIVYQAKENGVNMVCLEKRQPEGFEILIKVPTITAVEVKTPKRSAKKL